MKYTYGKIISLVVYNTTSLHKNSTNRIKIEFGPAKGVAFNAIISIPTLKKRESSISFQGDFITSLLI